jgi:hypothetical protein
MNLNSEIDLKIGLFIYNPEQEIEKSDNANTNSMLRQSTIQGFNPSAMLSGSFGQSEEDLDDIEEHLISEEED